jgi:hypothetical protein
MYAGFLRQYTFIDLNGFLRHGIIKKDCPGSLAHTTVGLSNLCRLTPSLLHYWGGLKGLAFLIQTHSTGA